MQSNAYIDANVPAHLELARRKFHRFSSSSLLTTTTTGKGQEPTASSNQTGQASTHDGARNRRRSRKGSGSNLPIYDLRSQRKGSRGRVKSVEGDYPSSVESQCV